MTTKHGSNGNGDVCPVDREHGHMYVLVATKHQYCPNQVHDRNGTPKVYGQDGVTPIPRQR